MKLIFFVCFTILVGAIFLVTTPRQSETYRDKDISAGTLKSPITALFAHHSDERYLKIGQDVYKGVRGGKPFYLNIAELNSIFFVTEDRNHHVLFHVFNLRDGTEIAIDGGTSGFGWSIGSGKSAGEIGSDYIEKVQSNKITIATRSIDWKVISVLNLNAKNIESQEVVGYDLNGKITNRTVYPK